MQIDPFSAKSKVLVEVQSDEVPRQLTSARCPAIMHHGERCGMPGEYRVQVLERDGCYGRFCLRHARRAARRLAARGIITVSKWEPYE